jgi:hypothetical protein
MQAPLQIFGSPADGKEIKMLQIYVSRVNDLKMVVQWMAFKFLPVQ